jgi:hypothetical protein
VEENLKKFLNKRVVLVWKESEKSNPKDVVATVTNVDDKFIFLKDDFDRDITVRIDCIISIRTWGKEK